MTLPLPSLLITGTHSHSSAVIYVIYMINMLDVALPLVPQ